MSLIHRSGQALTGSSATADAVLTALGGADIAHLAAHGTFRADNPLFSSLELVDGPLTVYDLELLEEAPTLCVLSACESGLSDVRAGDELMGLTATLLALGTVDDRSERDRRARRDHEGADDRLSRPPCRRN